MGHFETEQHNFTQSPSNSTCANENYADFKIENNHECEIQNFWSDTIWQGVALNDLNGTQMNSSL